MSSRHVVLAGRADQYLAGCWQSQESTKLCTRDYDYDDHHHYHHYHHHHHHRRQEEVEEGKETGDILGVTVLRPRCYYGDKLGKGDAKKGRSHTFLIAISNTFARRLMRDAEKFRHRGDVPCDAIQRRPANGKRNAAS